MKEIRPYFGVTLETPKVAEETKEEIKKILDEETKEKKTKK